jgi:5-methyltetrahydrofolate--homocysteine methyltransferase
VEPLLERLQRDGVVLGDGAWGTQLLARGLTPGTPPETWTLDHGDVIRDIAREYLDAGAEIITTNTFGGSPIRLRQHGLAGEVDRINRCAVDLVRSVAGDRAYVSASVGPSGRMLAPIGDVSVEELEDSFAAQIAVLADAGADIICVETMTDVVEAAIAVRAARAVAPSLPVIASMTFELTPRGPFTIMGVSPERAARELSAAGAGVLGINCGQGVDESIEVARALAAHTEAALSVRPNAGLPQQSQGRLEYAETPEIFAAAASKLLLNDRVRIVGGCCGTSPAHVRALALMIQSGDRK